jgi:putative nucleotidyltransferase with HDIG domain
MILAKGGEVRRQHVEDLQAESAAYWASLDGTKVMLQRWGGVALLLALVFVGGIAWCARRHRHLLDSGVQVLAFALLTIGLAASGRLCVLQGITPLWTPVALMVMVMCLVHDQFFGLGVAVFYGVLVRLVAPGNATDALILLLGGLTAALLTSKVRTRGTLIGVGVATGAVQFLAVWGLGLMSVSNGAVFTWRFWESPLMFRSAWALANGVASGFVVSGLLPVIERLFGVTTDIRLLEWSDPNQPLLQRLLVEAPGTYHHSMVVGSLAGDAAEEIGANGLLARVSAYFHDVGKLKKPEYFGENLPAGARNPHDDLSPTMSTLIITAHPKDGADMAAEYGVPKPVRDIVLQSHGTSVLSYFLGKAREGHGDGSAAAKRNFRYRLSKPASKEAAVVMLCDAAESAGRSMKSLGAGQIRTLVHQIIQDRLNDGQLDESGLTITDLHKLEKALVHGLAAVFHNRVRYPGQEKLEQETSAAQSESEAPKENGIGADRDLQQAGRS